ncbi:MAG: glutaredoxin family protein [Burkholderiales bacterium]
MPGIEATPRPRLTVYGRTYCHLCDDMILALRTLQERFMFDLRIVDVDSNADLEAHFGEKVPVLMHEDRELCHYFIDEPVVTALLSNLR